MKMLKEPIVNQIDPTTDNRSSGLIDLLQRSVRDNIRQYTMILALLAIWIIFTILTNNIFLSPRNLSNLFLQSSHIAIIAICMVLIIVAGHIDLSVGSVAGFTGAVAAVLMVKLNMGTVPTIIITLLVGLAIGAWHGFWVAYRGVPAFIVTLASMTAFKGGIIMVTGGASISEMAPGFKAIGQSYLPQLFYKGAGFNDSSLIFGIICIVLFIIFDLSKRNSRIKYGFSVIPMRYWILKIIGASIVIGAVMSIMIRYRGVPYAILLVMLLVVIFSFIAQNTPFGRYIYAIGGNLEAARLSGINVKKSIMGLFIAMGVMTSVSGIVFTARLNAATTSAGGLFELDAIASAVIGGTSLMGGKGTIFGAIVGALVMASIDNGMSLMNIESSFQFLVKGAVLLLAVWVDISNQKK